MQQVETQKLIQMWKTHKRDTRKCDQIFSEQKIGTFLEYLGRRYLCSTHRFISGYLYSHRYPTGHLKSLREEIVRLAYDNNIFLKQKREYFGKRVKQITCSQTLEGYRREREREK